MHGQGLLYVSGGVVGSRTCMWGLATGSCWCAHSTAAQVERGSANFEMCHLHVFLLMCAWVL